MTGVLRRGTDWDTDPPGRTRDDGRAATSLGFVGVPEAGRGREDSPSDPMEGPSRPAFDFRLPSSSGMGWSLSVYQLGGSVTLRAEELEVPSPAVCQGGLGLQSRPSESRHLSLRLSSQCRTQTPVHRTLHGYDALTHCPVINSVPLAAETSMLFQAGSWVAFLGFPFSPQVLVQPDALLMLQRMVGTGQ